MIRPRTASFRRIWVAPLVLALVVLASLVGALVAEGVWDWIATLALAGALTYAFVKGLRSDEA